MSATRSDEEDFLDGELVFVRSSNVAAVQYHRQDRKLMVEYRDGRAYLYSDVSESEALALLRAPSKGTWTWDVLRVRGSKTEHRKAFVQLR